MQKPKALLLFLYLTFSSLFLLSQQVMVNLEWEAATGNPSDLIDYSASAFDDVGNLIVVGNTITNGESENFLVSKFDTEGVLQWEYEYNFNDADSTDFATAVACDQSNNIYVTGASFDDLTNSFDYATLKLNASGNLQWVVRYNGTDNLDDIASAIGTDINGNIYVTGGSKTQAGGWDYYILKYDSTGSQQWAVNYDYGQLDDFPSELHVETGSGELTVVGGSASSATAWDFATIHYDSDGNWLSTDREPSGIGTFDKPMAFFQDDFGNMYITGSKSSNGIDFDIMTLKLNAGSQLKWTQTFDGHGMEDGAYDVIADPQGNVYVAGYTQKSSLGMNFLVLKYDSTGTLLWQKERTPYQPQDTAKATEIGLDVSGNVYVTGYTQEQGDKDVLTMCFDPSGQSGWEKVFENPSDPEEYATDILVDIFGNCYVTARSIDLAASSYILIHYSSHEREIVLMTDSTNNQEIAQNELIFRVAPQYLKLDKIDNTDIHFGTVDDFIQSELRNLMADKLGLGTSMGATPMYKLCPFLTRADTLSVLPNGDSVRNPNYYATFVLSLPLPVAEQAGDLTAKEAVDSLMLLHPKIWAAEECRVLAADIGANDYWYNFNAVNGQQSLHPLTPYSQNWASHINVPPAWDHVYGPTTLQPNPHIRVGVLDVGTLWTHEDFRINQADTTFNPSNSKIKGGKDLNYQNLSIFRPGFRHRDHGTAVSGIIGALRNDTIGIAGIAGGDMTRGDTGTDLYDYNLTLQGGVSPYSGYLVPAIEAAKDEDSVNIVNMSFGFGFPDYFAWEAIENGLKHQITFIGSRGNDNSDTLHFPACYPGVIGVGATDEYGRRYIANFSLQQTTANSGYSGSNFGEGLDLMAPGVYLMIQTTWPVSTQFGFYRHFGGTSAAAPHVTGVIALLMRHYSIQKSTVLPANTPQKLAPEDTENILELTAFDIDGSIGSGQVRSYAWSGVDPQTGHGLIDAGAALEKITWPDYQLGHFEENGFNTQFQGNVHVFLEQWYTNRHLNQTHSNQAHHAQKHKVTAAIPYTSPSGYHVDTFWVRNSASHGWAAPSATGVYPPDPFNTNGLDYIFPTTHLEIDSANQSHIFVSAYAYYVSWSHLNPTDSIWWPIEFDNFLGIDDPQFAVSILFKKNGLGVETEVKTAPELKIFPNPTDDKIQVQYWLNKPSQTMIRLFSMDGRLLLEEKYIDRTSNTCTKSLSVGFLPKGMYLIEVKTEERSLYGKLIKK